MGLVVAAVLPSSRKDLEEKLALFAGIPPLTRVQIDVVDGRFATPACWPYTAPAELREMISSGETLPYAGHLEYEMDLMCLDAEAAIADWIALGATRFTLHAEAVPNLPRLLKELRHRYGHAPLVSLGLALNVSTDPVLIEPSLADVDYVQFMGIATIGRQGQPFDRRTLGNVKAFRAKHPEVPVQIDGGVSLESAKELVALGVSNLIEGSGILRAANPVAAVAAIEALPTMAAGRALY